MLNPRVTKKNNQWSGTWKVTIMKIKVLISLISVVVLCSCGQTGQTGEKFSGKDSEIKIIQLNPTHSHAATAQNEHLPQIDTNVFVYTPDKSEVTAYLERIHFLNTRKNNPTKWNEVVYSGADYLKKMVEDKKGNVVVIAGNNRVKIEYIEQSVNAGMNVFSDKPMVINKTGFERLKDAYAVAQQKNVLMFDMMTERYNLMNRIQRSLMMDTVLFGKMQYGSPEHPAIMESSVHHFYRGGKGNRPYWFFDVAEEGEGIADVATHLIDLTFWKTFPDEVIDYNNDVKVVSAQHSPIDITETQFKTATSLSKVPESLHQYMKDTILKVYANGDITYRVKGVYATVKVDWNFEPPKGSGDLRSAYAKGSECTLLIKQEYGQAPKLYARKGEKTGQKDFEDNLKQSVANLQTQYPGISLSKEYEDFQIVIPPDLKIYSDPIFSVFIGYLVNRDMPEWEIPNTIAKYYITTTALEMTSKN